MNSEEEARVMELDFHTRKEITLNDVSPYSMTIPLKHVQRKNVKPETMLYNLTKSINWNDISDIDYTTGATSGYPIKALSERFSDNVIFYYLVPIDPNNKNKNDYLSKYLAEHTSKIKRLLTEYNININKRYIKPTYSSKKGEYYKQYIKVALPTIPVNDVFALITNEESIKSFNNEGIYINDIDFTQDFAGVINKEEVIQYLIENKDYVMEGSNDDGDYVIMDNNKLVGKNCLTFVHNTEYGAVRYKFYNKFLQSIESPSVRGKIGSHIADWLSNPDEQLRNTINDSLETGLLRLEITFYINNNAVSEEYVHNHLNYLTELLPPELIYYNPINNQWKSVLNKLEYNLLVVDLDNEIALFSYFINDITSKVNGFYLYNITDNYVNNVLKLFSFNIPILVVTCKRNNDDLIIREHCYEKILVPNITKRFELDELVTYLTNGNKRFTPIHKLDALNAINLEDTSIAKFRVINIKNFSTIKTENVPIKFIDSTVYFVLKEMRNTLEQQYLKELEDEKMFMKKHDDTIKSVKADNDKVDSVVKSINDKYDKMQEEVQAAKQLRMDLCNYLVTELMKPKTHYKRLLDQEPAASNEYYRCIRRASRRRQVR